ncbi:MAG: hypothetical protein HC835_20625 [Oscillatoriales cyanobacterium RM2_1_1]|nr:hypothetical protein [Oscillatoriales cyanobacterium SM2_3_0]NJO47810.1 hypothetical protein [Oscillatoriales cyanobacterium RM2_1_1]
MVSDGRSYSHTFSDEQTVYAHLQFLAKSTAPAEILQRFRNLFLGEQEYAEPQVWKALSRIVDSYNAPQEFPFVLNRSCYIFINCWLPQPRLKWAVAELVELLEVEPTGLPPCWTAKRLRSHVRRFTEGEHYQALRRLAKALKPEQESRVSESQTLDSLIIRYPYLYDHVFLTQASTDEQRQDVRQMRHTAQSQFDQELFQCMTAQPPQEPQERLIWQPPPDPTILGDRKFREAVKHFTGKVDGRHTYPELAKLFVNQSKSTPSYRTFKEELYEYITASIDTKYGRNRFNQRLYTELQDTLSYYDGQKLTETLLTGTCRKLLNFMVVEGGHEPSHFVFLDLTNNLGATPVTGLLLKVVLICRRVKSDLEKRFSVLFNHYSLFPKNQVKWLVESLENLNIAFSLMFGGNKLSW